MITYFVTGACGFVGHYFINHFKNIQTPIKIIACARGSHAISVMLPPHIEIINYQIELNDFEAVKKALQHFQPQYIIHLAAVSSVSQSWLKPLECIQNNTTIFLNILESVRILEFKTRILSISSSEVYDVLKTKILKETSKLNANNNPYALARISQENYSQFYVKNYHLDIVNVRAFMHIGPLQTTQFVVSAFIDKALDTNQKKIFVGNLDVVRDITDVRDTVCAYHNLLEKGQSGAFYNVCSGRGIKLKNVLKLIFNILGYEKEVVIDPNLLRKQDTMKIVGSYEKLRELTQWQPSISLIQTLKDMITDKKQKLLN
ncbi:MAG: GDP-mannose 4,6-dehydratase [Alphaproteobacteria bacterium]|nr:GDP-mannose 4,6-dehydratase [Alphaproteobacteria bacterium]